MCPHRASARVSHNESTAADGARGGKRAAESARRKARRPDADATSPEGEVRSHVMAAFEASMIEYDELYKRFS